MPIPNKYYEDFVAELPSLKGKCIAITGTTSGTGFWCAMAAIQKGATALLLLNRASSRATAADADLTLAAAETKTAVHSVVCDLMSFESVKKAASEAKGIAEWKYGGLDLLITNAGIMAMADDRTEDGYDVQMQVNHLSHFLLTAQLMPALEKAAGKRGEARVVMHSSAARFLGLGPRPFGATMEKCEPGTLGGNGGAVGLLNFAAPQIDRYCHSKLANAVFTQVLSEKLLAKGSKVKAVCCEPGLAETALITKGFHTATDKPMSSKMKDTAMSMFSCMRFMQSGPDGAMPLMMAAFGADVASGDMYCPSKTAPLPKPPSIKMVYNKGLPQKTIAAGVPLTKGDKKERDAISDENKATLWAKSEAAVGAFPL